MKVQLPKALADFKLRNWKGGDKVSFGKFGQIEVSKLTIKQAESLIQKGFPYLEKKKRTTLAVASTPKEAIKDAIPEKEKPTQ